MTSSKSMILAGLVAFAAACGPRDAGSSAQSASGPALKYAQVDLTGGLQSRVVLMNDYDGAIISVRDGALPKAEIVDSSLANCTVADIAAKAGGRFAITVDSEFDNDDGENFCVVRVTRSGGGEADVRLSFDGGNG